MLSPAHHSGSKKQKQCCFRRLFLTFQDQIHRIAPMSIKISTLVDKKVWKEVQNLSQETRQSLSGMVTEALEEYIRRKRLRPDFLKNMEKSIEENEALGRLLAK